MKFFANEVDDSVSIFGVIFIHTNFIGDAEITSYYLVNSAIRHELFTHGTFDYDEGRE